jgi:hypothetical protein
VERLPALAHRGILGESAGYGKALPCDPRLASEALRARAPGGERQSARGSVSLHLAPGPNAPRWPCSGPNPTPNPTALRPPCC